MLGGGQRVCLFGTVHQWFRFYGVIQNTIHHAGTIMHVSCTHTPLQMTVWTQKHICFTTLAC